MGAGGERAAQREAALARAAPQLHKAMVEREEEAMAAGAPAHGTGAPAHGARALGMAQGQTSPEVREYSPRRGRKVSCAVTLLPCMHQSFVWCGFILPEWGKPLLSKSKSCKVIFVILPSKFQFVQEYLPSKHDFAQHFSFAQQNLCQLIC